jgi:glycosyltransferase involved in cell wall biosynthesis
MYGSDRALLGLLDELSRHFSITMVAAVDGPMLDAARALGVEVVVSSDWALRRKFFTPAGFLPAMGRVAASLRTLRSLHRRRRFAAVYANTVANTLLPFLRIAVRAPVIVHVREVPRTGARLNRVWFGAISRVASKLICNSTYTGQFVAGIETRLADRIVVVNDGTGPVDPAGGTGGPPLEVVCVGRIHPQKGQHVMVEALRLGVADGHDWRVHFWGDALPEHEDLRRDLVASVDAAGLADRVVWHGYDSDPSAMYRGMDVAVVPSTWPEGFSLVTAEAQAAGLPVVATGPGGPTDIVVEGETGRIVPFDDAAAVAAALVELEDADRRERWGAAGRRRHAALFTTERSARAVADVVVEVSGSGRQPSD